MILILYLVKTQTANFQLQLQYYEKDSISSRSLEENICAVCGQSTNSASDATDPEPAYKLSCGHVYPFVTAEFNHVHVHVTWSKRRQDYYKLSSKIFQLPVVFNFILTCVIEPCYRSAQIRY